MSFHVRSHPWSLRADGSGESGWVHSPDGLYRVAAKGCHGEVLRQVPGLGMVGRFLHMMGPMEMSDTAHVGVEGLARMAELADLGRPDGQAQRHIYELAELAMQGRVTCDDREVLRVAVRRLMEAINAAANDEPYELEGGTLNPMGRLRDGQFVPLGMVEGLLVDGVDRVMEPRHQTTFNQGQTGTDGRTASVLGESDVET
ncbi:hypothetical protein Mmc1_0060 [Magnetococcus marinus MC-1]|uniref:Uncharacterized protein n=1 Tax=Magnetococcus marinus (strain ATCC BAA-1437 / JCM 17883 / MC-1) TaxID=156889 RepID=A0L3P6_MAGMM|nr:hypothetical protein [Magnetococcus marinus]ABK42589.1 hypothetical protein Mmc1_0060 [Magnetococcus marinus MC-1]